MAEQDRLHKIFEKTKGSAALRHLSPALPRRHLLAGQLGRAHIEHGNARIMFATATCTMLTASTMNVCDAHRGPFCALMPSDVITDRARVGLALLSNVDAVLKLARLVCMSEGNLPFAALRCVTSHIAAREYSEYPCEYSEHPL